MGNQKSDPVCGMQIESDQFTIDYLQVHYIFCSKQCQERFLENPRLYVGDPDQEPPSRKKATK